MKLLTIISLELNNLYIYISSGIGILATRVSGTRSSLDRSLKNHQVI